VILRLDKLAIELPMPLREHLRMAQDVSAKIKTN
jgi:hypothetical protein